MVSMPEDTALTPSQIEDLRFAEKKKDDGGFSVSLSREDLSKVF